MTKIFIPSQAQTNLFNWVQTGTGNAIVVAVAGGGKTTSLIEALKFMNGFVFMGAYNSKMGKELKQRTAGMRGVKAGTFHSLGLLGLQFAYKNNTLKLDDKKCANIADMICEDRPDLAEIKGPVCAIVSMAKQRGFYTPMIKPNPSMQDWVNMIEHFGLAENLPEDFNMEQVVKFANCVLKKSNADLDVIDFNDMVYMPLHKNIRMLQNDWVIIDEAQDTNPTRRALARKVLKPTGRLVAVGDPHQAIFGFTGADNDSLDQIKKDFSAIELPLTVSYRCPKAVVAHAQQWVNHIQSADNAPEGIVRDLSYDDLIPELVAGDAILCRYNKYLVNLCFKLIRQGIPAKIEGRAIGQGLITLAKRWKVKNLNALVPKLKAYMDKEVQKLMEKKQEDKADQLVDKVETLLVLVSRAREKGMTTIAELEGLIMSMFSDDISEDSKLVILSSIHKSKGLEWERVYLLGRSELQPSPMARQAWQVEQEINLIYVAVTRAKSELVNVTGVREEDKQLAE